jgi:hypothetical protein
LKYADAAAQFGIAGGKSAVQNIVKGGPYEAFIGFKRQRMVPPSVFEIEVKLVDQAIILRNRHLPVSRLVIMQNFATLPIYSSNILSQIMQIIGNLVKRDIQSRPNLPEDEFTFLQTFDVGEKFIRGVIERRQLKSIGLHGEGADADEALKLPSTIARMNELREIIAEYPRSQVYNQDESGLYFRCLPNRTYLFETKEFKRARGSKVMKDKSRLTEYMCTSADGKKVPLAFIGKSKRPRCFRNNPILQGAHYFDQKNAWSDAVVYQEWFDTVFLPFVRAQNDEPILLLQDNHTSHDGVHDPRGQVRVEGLPPNITSRKQPMDAGIIKTSKTHYRYELLRHTVAVALGNPLPDDFPQGGLAAGRKADVGDAIHIALKAWDKVSAHTIVRCWLKCDLLPENDLVAMTRAHGKAEVDSVMEMMNSLVLSIPENVPSKQLAGIRTAIEDSDGAIEHWVNLEDDPLVQEAEVLDSLVDNEDPDEVKLQCYNHYYTLK